MKSLEQYAADNAEQDRSWEEMIAARQKRDADLVSRTVDLIVQLSDYEECSAPAVHKLISELLVALRSEKL